MMKIGESIQKLWDAIAKERAATHRPKLGRADTVGKHAGNNRRKFDAGKAKRRRRIVRASRRQQRRHRR